MIRNVITLVMHDLAVAFKNKTIFLIVCIPLFVYGTLMLVDRPDAATTALKLGFVKMEPYATALRKNIDSAPGLFSIHEAATLADGKRMLIGHEIDGLVLNAEDDPSRVVVLVIKKESPSTLAILQRFSALQLAAEGTGTNWISAICPLHASTIGLQSLPTWILMVVLLVSFFVIPTQVAEEKEKQSLLGLLQTPMREGEWLAAKIVYGIILMLTAVLALQLLSKSPCVRWTYLITLGVGSFCFGAMGVSLGLLCRSQASARTLGVICYLPLLLPAALSDVSKDLKSVASFLPSSSFYEPIQSVMLDSGNMATFPVEWLKLVCIGTAACIIGHKLLKARWLM